MLLILFAALSLAGPSDPAPFAIPSFDGHAITGQVDRPDLAGGGAVVMVAGTGPFDRDAVFSAPGQPPAPVFADLAARLNPRGVAVVRYDKRGVRHGAAPGQAIDPDVIVTATTDAMRDDLAAVYDWTRRDDGLGARCVALFGHSEGMVHIGRLAASGASEPVAVVGMGAILTDPVTNFRWNLVERDAYSLRAMDADGDGATTNDEVRAGLAHTPAAVNGVIEPYLHPEGGWSIAAIERLEQAQAAIYAPVRDQMLAAPDAAPWPAPGAGVVGVQQWWKSWVLDDTPVAANLARWTAPVIVHLGDRDSQTHPPLQRAAGEQHLGVQLTFHLHPGVGHTLGDSPTWGPIRPDLADQLADHIATALADCAGGG